LRDSSNREAKLSSLLLLDTDVDIETMKILWRFLKHRVHPDSRPAPRRTARDTWFSLPQRRPSG
jgi:hypothetical protein